VNNSISGVVGYAFCKAKTFATPEDLRLYRSVPECVPILPNFVQVLSWYSGNTPSESDVSMSKLFHNASSSPITGLILGGAGFLFDTKEIIDLSDCLPHVTCLNLDYYNRLGFYTLVSLLRLSKVQRVSFRDVHFLESGEHPWHTYIRRQTDLPAQLWFRKLWLDSVQKIPNLINIFNNVTGLSLRGSNLETGDLLKILPAMKDVMYLDLSDNSLSFEMWTFLAHLVHLRALDLSNNRIGTIPSVTDVPRPANLNPPANRLPGVKHVPTVFPQLRFFDVSAQRMSFYVTADILSHPALLELHINAGLQSLIEYIGRVVMRVATEDNTVLQLLSADGSDLKWVNDEEQFVNIFGHLKALRTLSLARSFLDFVSPAMFANFVNLTTLNLKDNIIYVLLDGTFDSLSQLQYLDLSGNKITVITHHSFSGELRQQFKSVDLGQNPFVCSCDLVFFR
jgi:hypothetical protein